MVGLNINARSGDASQAARTRFIIVTSGQLRYIKVYMGNGVLLKD